MKIEMYQENKKCYIAGKISGIPEAEFRLKFDQAKKDVEKIGLIPISPIDLPHYHEEKWELYMREDISEMMKCDYIFILPDWEDSRGAVIEVELAKKLGIKPIGEKIMDHNIFNCLFAKELLIKHHKFGENDFYAADSDYVEIGYLEGEPMLKQECNTDDFCVSAYEMKPGYHIEKINKKYCCGIFPIEKCTDQCSYKIAQENGSI